MENLLTNLKTVIFRVMEQMFFLLPDDDSPASTGDESDSVYIGISGNPAYRITLQLDRALAGSMTLDLLGAEGEELNSDLILKSLRETANIIGGNFLLSFDENEQRNVTLPSNEKIDIFPDGTTIDSGSFPLTFNGQGMLVTLETVTV